MQASEETYRAMFEASPVPYMVCDRDQKIRQVNHAFEQCFGYQLRDIPTLDAVSYTHLRAHETVLDPVCRLLLQKKKNTQQKYDFLASTALSTTSVDR